MGIIDKLMGDIDKAVGKIDKAKGICAYSSGDEVAHICIVINQIKN